MKRYFVYLSGILSIALIQTTDRSEGMFMNYSERLSEKMLQTSESIFKATKELDQ
jgi:hypothetical protein